MELPLPKDHDIEKLRQASLMADLFMRILDQSDYEIKLDQYPNLRICGVHEGELFFGMRCKVYKVEKKT